jgi:Protein of unknown function (DUF1416)
MARITGHVKTDGGTPAVDAYVQLRDKDNEFCGETRCGDDGAFTLYAVPGSWLLVAWLPAGPRANEAIEIDAGDVDVELSLEPVPA